LLYSLRISARKKNLEKIKRELVAHISHELRTPLTIIKGYLETLEEEKLDEVSLSFIARIKDNVDRLERLVRDLLTLAELESQQELAARERVNLEELAKNVINQFENMAKEKNLFLRLELPAEIPSVFGDAFRLEQMLTNLVDNALKYTDKGGVTIRLEKGEKEVLITVQDTGIGIAPEHLDRIFERFYVVDRSRSRKFGELAWVYPSLSTLFCSTEEKSKLKALLDLEPPSWFLFPFKSDQL
jgi:two-component system phosphate regulon sensor histidine kinase PhoR